MISGKRRKFTLLFRTALNGGRVPNGEEGVELDLSGLDGNPGIPVKG